MPVYKQPNSKNWLIEFKADGRRYRRSSGTKIKRKAERLEDKWRQEIHDGKHQIAAIEHLTVEEATRRYWETVFLAKSSRERSKKAESYVLRVIVRAFGPHTRLNAIRVSDIARWRDEMVNDRKAPATANRYLAILRAILNRAHLDWNALSVVPRIRLLPLNNTRHRILSHEEELRVLEASASHLKNLVVFLVDTGARLSEALDLTWDDVSLSGDQRSSVTLLRTKNGTPRRIPLTWRTNSLLMRLKNEDYGSKHPLFQYKPGKSSPPRPFKHPFGAWKTALRKANVDQSLRIHDLRHTFASRLVMKGVPLFDVSKLLGHKSISMTMRYAHLAPEAYETAIERLEGNRAHDSLESADCGSSDVIDFSVEHEKRKM